MKVKLVGISKWKSKAGRDMITIHMVRPATVAENEKGTTGSVTSTVVIFEEMQRYFTPDKVGKEMELQYEPSYNGQAVLKGVIFA